MANDFVLYVRARCPSKHLRYRAVKLDYLTFHLRRTWDTRMQKAGVIFETDREADIFSIEPGFDPIEPILLRVYRSYGTRNALCSAIHPVGIRGDRAVKIEARRHAPDIAGQRVLRT